MKNIIVTIILISGLQVNAQYIIPVEQMTTYLLNHNYDNHYFKDVNGVLNKFVGNWKYETTSEKLEIEIYKLENINNGGGSRYQDEIELRFRYTNNGIVMFDTFNSNTNLYIIGLRFDIPTNTNIYRFLYREPGQDTKGSIQYLDIEYIPSNNGGQPQLNWSVYTELSASDDENPPQMPLNMVLTKLP